MKSIFILLCFFIQASSAQETVVPLQSLQTELTQKNQTGPQYQVGDRIQLNVRIPLELSRELTTVKLKPLDDKNSLDQLGWYLDPSPQIINGNLHFVASPIKSGKLTLPELLISKDDSKMVGKTTPIEVEVTELKADPSATPALLDTISISLPTKFIILGLLIVAFLVSLAFFVYKKYFQSKIKPIKTEEIKLPPTPDHIIAMRDLNLLYESYSYSKENLKPVAFGVSQILKTFFSSRFKIDAKESTTDEMIQLLKGESISEQEIKKIQSLFVNLDLIKFTETEHHQQFQKGDYFEFKEITRSLIDSWAIKGDQS